MTYTKEISITRTHARGILSLIERGAEHDAEADYFVCETEDGGEYLHEYGMDEPIAQNHASMSWRKRAQADHFGTYCEAMGF